MKCNVYYKKCLKVLEGINKKFPEYNMGKVLVIALDEYDMWSISDKEMLFALEKYAAELEFDIPHISSMGDELNDIIRGGMNLHKLLEEEQEDCNEEDYI